MSGCTAWYVGGPRHGDIERHASTQDVILIPCMEAGPVLWAESKPRPDDSITYKRGEYRDHGRLYNMPDAPGVGPHHLYIWNGTH